jgi:peptidoglycan/xylan/chitin deacetylase (PgdA/CDA1 family)
MRALIVATLALLIAGCATASPPAPAETAAPTPKPAAKTPPKAPTAVVGESEEFVVVQAAAGDTAELLAQRHLGDAAKAWMIEDYNGTRSFTPGQQVVVPKRPWNLAGVDANGYQLVPILVYHNLGPQSKGRLLLGADAFAEQMRYLKSEGYRVVTLAEFVEWLNLKRQLPRRTVVLTFDDGYRAFRDHAYPVLKELGFTATLFVYTDYVGAGRSALAWDDLRSLVAEGFDVQAHSKTHGDLRRAPGETDAQYTRRMQAELNDPLKLFQRQLGRPVTFLAYPYGRVDDSLLGRVRHEGYAAAFTVRRESNAAFVPLLEIRRSQVYSEMTLQQFIQNLNLYHAEDLR